MKLQGELENKKNINASKQEAINKNTLQVNNV